MIYVSLDLPDTLFHGLARSHIEQEMLDVSDLGSEAVGSFRNLLAKAKVIALPTQEFVLKAVNKKFKANMQISAQPINVQLVKGDTLLVIKTVGLPLAFGRAGKEFIDPEIAAAQVFVTKFHITEDPQQLLSEDGEIGT